MTASHTRCYTCSLAPLEVISANRAQPQILSRPGCLKFLPSRGNAPSKDTKPGLQSNPKVHLSVCLFYVLLEAVIVVLLAKFSKDKPQLKLRYPQNKEVRDRKIILRCKPTSTQGMGLDEPGTDWQHPLRSPFYCSYCRFGWCERGCYCCCCRHRCDVVICDG